MLACMNHLAQIAVWPPSAERAHPRLTLEELIAVGFDNPLRAIGIEPAAMRERLAASAHGQPGGGGMLLEFVEGRFRVRSVVEGRFRV